MSPETKQFYEFGNFRLDLAEKILRRDGEPVALTPKVFTTLQVFVEHAGCLLEKEELMQKIWQDRFVDESNLTFNVKMLRRALGDNAANPTFIETVPRRGYRFIAKIREAVPDNNSLLPEIAETFAQPQKSFSPLVAIGIFLLCTIVLGSWLARNTIFAENRNAPILNVEFRAEKFLNSGKISLAVISPDGKSVAYTDETNGKFAIWLKHLETLGTVEIVAPSEEVYAGLAFSHDGKSIFFVRKLPGEQTPASVHRVPIDGDVPEKILERTEGWISLSPDDRQISFVRCERREDDFCSLLIADSDGKNERRVLSRPRPIRIGDHQFSPDGKRIAFAAGQSWNGASDFRLLQIDLTTNAESEISPKTFFDIQNLEWLPGGDNLLLTAMETLDGQAKIWQISAATGAAEPRTKDAANYRTISLNQSANQMIATKLDNDFHLSLTANGATKILTAAREATFAPDGRIVYATDDGDIWTIKRDGGEQRQLTNNAFKDFSPQISPDNRFIYFASNRTGTNQVWRMNADGGNQTQLTMTVGGYPCLVSPDGKWVFYESGLHQTLWRVSADGGAETQISERKVFAPAFSPDGNRVAYFFRDKQNYNQIKIAVMSLPDKKIFKTLNFPQENITPVKIAWSNDNQTLNYIIKNERKYVCWQQSLTEETARFVADLGDEEIADFALAPDSDDFVVVRGKWLHDAVLVAGLK